jgi:hypothetical protein
MRLRNLIIFSLALLVLAAPASARMELGALRVATSSGTFLKIGVSPRAEAMGGAWVAIASDATAAWYNPAGMGLLANRQSSMGYVAWPADIQYVSAAVGLPGGFFGGTWGLTLGNLSTVIDETTEYEPYGTGREFLYSDTVVGLTFAKFLTDKLVLGISGKYVREDLGSSIDLPVVQTWLVDAGTLYHIEWHNTRIGMSIQNFGPEFKPPGEYWNYSEEKYQEYEGFPPPSSFRLGMAWEAFKAWPWLLTHSFELNHPADNRETIHTGVELAYMGGIFALRGGYVFMADEMKLSAGFGTAFMMGSAMAGLDYSFTDGGDLGAIHRWGLRVDF